jgi:F420-non-reducing hydrogenase iron-sulfur subunit
MDLVGSKRALSPSVYPIRVTCAGRIDPAICLYAFEKGASGLLVIGCKEKECRYGPGPTQGPEMAERVRGILRILGVEPERFSTLNYASHETNRLYEDMAAFVKRIGEMGGSPLAPRDDGSPVGSCGGGN